MTQSDCLIRGVVPWPLASRKASDKQAHHSFFIPYITLETFRELAKFRDPSCFYPPKIWLIDPQSLKSGRLLQSDDATTPQIFHPFPHPNFGLTPSLNFNSTPNLTRPIPQL